MRRWDFIALVGGVAAWPLAGKAQQTGKVPTIGFLGATTLSASTQWVSVLRRQPRGITL